MMASSGLSWIVNADKLAGQGFEHFQVELAKYNGRQLNRAFRPRRGARTSRTMVGSSAPRANISRPCGLRSPLGC